MINNVMDSNALPYRFLAATPPGNTFERRWHLQYDLDDGTGPHDLPLTGCTLTLTVAQGTVEVVLRTIAPTDTSGGQFTQTITAADGAVFSGVYYSKVVCVFPIGHLVFPNGATKTVILGKHSYILEMI